MNTYRVVGVATALAFSMLLQNSVKAADEKVGGGWTTNYAAAAEKAKKEQKAILLEFTGSDWCGWCIKLKEEVFDKKEFKDWAAKHAVLVEVDFPRGKEQSAELIKQNQELSDKFPVEGYPTVVVLNSNGLKLGELGYLEGGPDAWSKACDAILKNTAASK